MSDARSALLSKKLLIHDGVGTLGAPSGAPAAGLLIDSWRSGSAGPRLIGLKLWGSDGSVDIAAGTEVYGWHAGDSRWYSVGVLDGGAAINVALTAGRYYYLHDLPAWATAVQLKTGAVSGGTISAEIEALEVRGGL